DPGLDQASIHPRHWLTVLLPYLYGRPGYPREFWGQTIYEFWAGTCYVGILPLVMLGFSPFAMKVAGKRTAGDLRRFLFLFFAGVALVGLILAAGKYTPFYMLLYQLVPGFSHFRWPSKFLVLVLYSLSILAGLGCQI